MSLANAVQVRLPPKLVPVFTKPARYRGAYGGRGSGKSHSFALMTAVRGFAKPERILCARELQNSIRDSVHAEIVNAIRLHPWLERHYEIGESYIRGANGTEYIFKGLRHNYQQIKSTSGVTICWVEEAESVTEASWATLIPTIRAKGSEIWATWNPESVDSSTNKRFVLNPPTDSQIVELNYNDNPWFPEALEGERQRDQSGDPDLYAHVWLGQPITRTDAQIFGGRWKVEEFTPGPGWDGPYDGLDFGFSSDPTAGVRVWIHGRRLCIEYECGKVGLELDDTAAYLRKGMPWDRGVIRADSARPESISYLVRNGLPGLIPVKKGPGSVESGIRHMRSYEIVVHPRCVEVQRELRLYSYKVDRLTGDVTNTIIDAFNHYIDAIRYAIEPITIAGGSHYGSTTSGPLTGGSFSIGQNLI